METQSSHFSQHRFVNMRAIHPKFLNKKAEVYGLEMRDVFICMSIISIMKFLDLSDMIVILIPGAYLFIKFVLKMFFPRSHFKFLVRKKKYFEWTTGRKE